MKWNKESIIFYAIAISVIAALIWPEKTFELLVGLRDSIKSLISQGENDAKSEPDTGQDG